LGCQTLKLCPDGRVCGKGRGFRITPPERSRNFFPALYGCAHGTTTNEADKTRVEQFINGFGTG
jgi:hypothetical protein